MAQCLGFWALTAMTQIQSLVRELTILCMVCQKKKKERKKERQAHGSLRDISKHQEELVNLGPHLSLATYPLDELEVSVLHCEMGRRFRQYLDDSIKCQGRN